MSEPMRATWAVQSQQMRTTVNGAGQVQEGYVITFLTGKGHTGQVFVPNSSYTPANVAEAIQAQADLLDAVGSLVSEGGS